MNILFKNITKYTKENCNNFTQFHTDKYGFKELTKIILIILCLIYIFISNIIYKNWKIVGGILILVLIIYLIRKKEVEKQLSKKNKIKSYTFYFYEKYIKIKCGRQFDRLKYFELHKIFETDEYFFLYTDEKSSLILSKDGFEIGTSKEFSKFIKKKCPFKYKSEE